MRVNLARRDGTNVDPASASPVIPPGLRDGVDGVAFVDAYVRSSPRISSWVKLNR